MIEFWVDEVDSSREMDILLTPLNLKAAIHIGASSISFLVTDADGAQVDYLEKSTSLAHDIFSKGSISRSTIEKCVKILGGYSAVLLELGISQESSDVRIVATNIVSEASNKDIFINRLQVGCGISVEVLDDGEMTRLIYMKTRRRLLDKESMQKNNTLVVHAGPGNTRVIFFKEGKIESYSNYRMGTNRLGESIRKNIDDDHAVRQVMTEQIQSLLDTVIEEYAEQDVGEIAFIGYEIQLMISHIKCDKSGGCSMDELDKLTNKLVVMDDDEIVSNYNLAYQMTESLVPSLIINTSIAKALGLDYGYIPSSNYEKGLLTDIHLSHAGLGSFIDEVLSSAWALAKKYKVNRKHAKQVARLSTLLFDELQVLHKLDEQDRLLLHCSALLHEAGGFISSKAHHKHSLYLIMHSEIFGLSNTDIMLIAIISRYHRNSPPKSTHPHYSELDTIQQMRVSKIASILRIADALDRTHTSRINDVKVKIKKKRLELLLVGIKDASVERITMKSKGDLFEDIFGLDITIQEDR